MINKTNISKSQHYVPKFYLKNFSRSDNKIHVFSKKNNRKFCSNISNIAHENYFYGIPDVPRKSKKFKQLTEEQRKQEIEKILGWIDDNSSKALSKFLEQIKSCKPQTTSIESDYKDVDSNLLEIDEQLRLKLSIFCVLQDLRTKKHKEIARQFYDGHLTKRIHSFDITKGLKINKEDVKATYKEEVIDLLHFQSLLNREHIKTLANVLFRKQWIICVNGTKIPFFTSDHPVVKHNYEESLSTGYYSSEIVIPLSPKYILIMVCPTVSQDGTTLSSRQFMFSKLKEEKYVILYNYLQVSQSYNYIFSNTNEFHMMEDYLKT